MQQKENNVAPLQTGYHELHQLLERITMDNDKTGGGGGSGLEPRVAKIEADVENIKGTITDVKSDIKELRTELRSEIKEFRTELKEDYKEIQRGIKTMHTTFLITIITTVVAVGTLIYTIMDSVNTPPP